MDVVEQGHRDRRQPPRWLHGGAPVVALVLAALVVTRPHLLSAGGSVAHRPDAAPTANRTPSPLRLGENTSQGISLVVRQGDHLERYEAGSGRWPLAMLPKGLPDPAAFVHAPLLDGSGPLVGVGLGMLFRTSPLHGRRVTPIGSADRVLAPSPQPGRLFVLLRGGSRTGPRLVELDARTGKITNQRPFPGYDAAGLWRPVAVVPSQDGSRLLLTRAANAGRVELALARARGRVASDTAPAGTAPSDTAPDLMPIGSATRILGVADSRILTLDDRPQTCVDRVCPITVRTITRDGLLTREVQPPRGWAFGTTVVGGEGGGDPLVLVSRVGDPARFALARLAPGGSSGLLVGETDGLVASVAPVGDPQGVVLFAVPRPEGTRVSVWFPGARSAALLLDLPALKAGAELVCACR
jgi:hypothetical protein